MIRYLYHSATTATLIARAEALSIILKYPPLKENLSVQEALAILEELPSDDDSAASNNSDTDEEYVENVAQGENISSDDEEIDEIQCPSTSQPEVTWVNYTGLKKLRYNRVLCLICK
ncbi:hypothetical protein TNCV_3863551 [Trichonephila clavipes]|uniref:Uncharacterized protein n=1 Tax=Trichonephila clavipes TaxID=2585209 RepID=A0A8X6SCQ2_TRICX|nr:hypothetical protein TNCV_3863551 [Trichonephila clavipes]